MDIDAHKMFDMVKNGEIALEDFLLWVEKTEDDAWMRGRDAGYDSGYSDGHHHGVVDSDKY